MEDGTYFRPERGVGLGYFSNIMTLVVASVLSDCNIVKMFNDDILCPIELYDQAIGNLTSLGFIINEKKSGKEWHKAPFFAGASLAPNGTLRYYEAQGPKAALFNKRYHYERKSIFVSQEYNYRWKLAYHYERIFGYEAHKGESLEHTSALGLMPNAPKVHGYVTGGILRTVLKPHLGDENQRRVWSYQFPWKEAKEKKSFNLKRRDLIKRFKNKQWYTEYHDYNNPVVKDDPTLVRNKPDFYLGKYQLPRWADLQALIAFGQTCGRTTSGRSPKKAAHYMLSYLLSMNPIESWINGGYVVDSDFYRDPGVDPWTQLLYDRLRSSTLSSLPTVNRRMAEDLPNMPAGVGITFMKNVMHGDERLLDFPIDVEQIDVQNEDSEDEVLDLDDMIDVVEYDYESEDE
jgi:hypothetical protein